MLHWLSAMPGTGWQQQWASAGCDHHSRWVDQAAEGDPRDRETSLAEFRAGMNWLFLARIIQPSYDYFLHCKTYTLFEVAPRVFSVDLFARLADSAAKIPTMSVGHYAAASNTLVKVVLHTGKDLEHLCAKDLLEFRDWHRGRQKKPEGINTAWDLLREAGVLDSDRAMFTMNRQGQRSTSELVDFYGIRSNSIRQVLIAYLEERRPQVDYASLRGIAGALAGTFWADIERHHPGIDSLDLPDTVATAWKERLAVIRTADGQTRPRKSVLDIFTAVRAFYLDIQEWAHVDASWARWAVRCPIRRGDTNGIVKARQQATAQMHQRVRERLPQLHVLVDTAERHLAHQQALLTAGRVIVGEGLFTHDGQLYRRIIPVDELKKNPRHRNHNRLAVEHVGTGARSDLIQSEQDAFWSWAIIETFRHTGVRIEELLEITHLALVTYPLPDTGEIVPLLQIVPSKSNEERLLLVSPELASVLATIITRLRRENGSTVALTARYDIHDRINGPALPHLFQRRIGNNWRVFSYYTVQRLLSDTVARTELRDAAGEPLRFTPHDFRRIFATDAVTGGLPVHIAARLLGHSSVATTQSYLAVFQDDLVRSYRSFLDNRRAVRPEAEYREPTSDEWREFEQHFQLRKLELGTCGRPYGSPCQHEHACIRCPMLRVDPQQRHRLVAISRNLSDRIAEAKQNHWLGEVRGLETSLAAANAKLLSLDRTARTTTGSLTDLGIPQLPPRHQH
ncbi:tyrosine-type recombinase/integrase [Amycolatopsis sp. RTGN1]|uniref:tyrosine-type recombinase/integrase n=1 Tax=Amycolatopsis ponsaeliensis TaxID=2992142 RepID=UPI00254D5E8A|nr:site-specific integrase [Amycolatopsis sp. RTGN1]